MKQSQFIINTYKDSPYKSKLKGHEYLFRSGMVKKISEGKYAFTPVGAKTLGKFKLNFEGILTKHGFLNVFSESTIEMFKNEINSHKSLPSAYYSFYNKINGEYKDKLGLLCSKDNYILSATAVVSNLDEQEKFMKSLIIDIEKILTEIGIEANKLHFETEKGKNSIDYIINSKEANDEYVVCDNCKTAMNKYDQCFEEPDRVKVEDEEMSEVTEVFTPNIKTIDQLAEFMELVPEKLLKTLVINADGKIFACILRGDRELNLHKVANLVSCPIEKIELASAEVVKKIAHTEIGFAGPVELNNNIKIIADEEVLYIKDMVTGANKNDYHLSGVNFGRDYKAKFVGDIKYFENDTKCRNCENEVEINIGAKIIKINGYKGNYDKTFDFIKYRNVNGKEAYGKIVEIEINISKMLGIYAQLNHDENGLTLGKKLAPFEVSVIAVKSDDEVQMNLAGRIYDEMISCGLDAILDDTSERAGSKFKNCELLSIPYRVVVGKKAPEGIVEVKSRLGGVAEDMTVDDAIAFIKNQYDK